MLLHASVESGICARKAWGSRLQKARTATNVCFHREKITEAVMFIKNQKCLKDGMRGNVSNCYEIESDCFEIFQSQLGNLRILPFECLSCSACGSKKQDAAQIGV